MRQLLTVFNLTILLFFLDLILRPIYPAVDLIRAGAVGLLAYGALLLLARARPGLIEPLPGAISIYASALFSVLLIMAGLLESQTLLSGIVHVVVLALTFLLADSRKQQGPETKKGGAE